MDVNHVTYVTGVPPARAVARREVRGRHSQGDEPMTHSGPPRKRTGAWILVTILLLVAVLGTLIVPIYTRNTPKLGSFPFFYWYQLIWVPAIAILSWLVYLLLRNKPAPGADPRASAGDERKSQV